MSATLQDLVKRDELTVVPGVFDALTAKLAEDVGFEAALSAAPAGRAASRTPSS